MREQEQERYGIQERQYEFPYHYIPHFTRDGVPSLTRRLSWGLDYLCYHEHLREKVSSMHPGSVLEVGCGDGYFIGGLPPTIPVRLGIDLSSRAIAFAKAFHPDCEFHARDVRFVEGEYDVVVAIEVLEHIPDSGVSDFLAGMNDRLAPEGSIVISVPTTVLPVNRKHFRHYTRALLESQVLESGVPLEIVDVEYVYRKPWWESAFRRLLDNRYFGLEVKPFMRIAWRHVWERCRFADHSNGYHMVAVLRRV